MAITGGTAEWQGLFTQAIGTENTLVLLKHDLELDMLVLFFFLDDDERRPVIDAFTTAELHG